MKTRTTLLCTAMVTVALGALPGATQAAAGEDPATASRTFNASHWTPYTHARWLSHDDRHRPLSHEDRAPWWRYDWERWLKYAARPAPVPVEPLPTPTEPPASPSPIPAEPSPSPTPTEPRPTPTEPSPTPAPGGALWPGHQPGKVILGMSCGSNCAEKQRELGQGYGVHRQFTGWGDWSGVIKKINEDHAANRLPWVSIKGPEGGSPAGWRALQNNQYNAEIVDLATRLKANDDKPIILTFHHEPSNDGTEAEGKDWAGAYARFNDVLKEHGALENVAFAPVLGDWLFNARNKGQEPANWATKEVLSRAPFMGIDLYENTRGETFAQRIPRIISWMADQGFPDKMVGIGEMGGTDARYDNQSAVSFINESLAWAQSNTDKIGLVSYFNSTANSRSQVHWPLDESSAKLNTYKRWLGDSRFAAKSS